MNNDETITIEWLGPRDINGERYTISHDSLTISPLTEEDDGKYTCNIVGDNALFIVRT